MAPNDRHEENIMMAMSTQRRRRPGSWRCILGCHQWRFHRQSNSFYAAFPDRMAISRECNRCGAYQITDDGQTWSNRA